MDYDEGTFSTDKIAVQPRRWNMFYCAECARKSEWPLSAFQSFGKCEVCGRVASCNDVPSYLIPTKTT